MKTTTSTPRSGFSLAELMVVIVIIALLATFVVNNAIPYIFKASKAKASADIASLVTAVTSFAVQNGGKFPDSLEILVTPDENGVTYLENRTTVPLDPWKNQYMYEPPSGGNATYRVFSYGADGQPGGEGDDADIDNFSILEE